MTLSDSSTYDYVFLGLGCGNGLMLLQLEAEGMLTNKRILVIEPNQIIKNDRTFCLASQKSLFQHFRMNFEMESPSRESN